MKNTFHSVRREADAFSRRWRRKKQRGFRDEAAMLTGAQTLRAHAIEAAVGLRAGRPRDLLLRVRDSADKIIKSSHGRLASGSHIAFGD